MVDEAARSEVSGVATLRLAARTLIVAVEEHLAVVTEGKDPSEEQEALLRALASYDDAFAAVTGKSPMTPEATGVSPEESADAGGVLSVLTRTDHYVEDFEQLIEAGRCAYRGIQPDAGEDEVRAQVPDVSSALYEILHANEDEVPFPFPAARPIAGMAWFLSPREAMPVSLDDRPEEPFGVAAGAGENLLYAHRHIYAPPGAG
jgi:hypothetical protein